MIQEKVAAFSGYWAIVLVLLAIVAGSANAQVSELEVQVNWPNWSSDNKVEVYDPAGTLILEICDPVNCQTTTTNSSYATTVNIGCYADGSGYYLLALDAFGDGWNGTGSFVEVRSGGATFLNYDLTSGSNSGQQFFTVSGGGNCSSLDAMVDNITTPVSGCGLSNSETATVVIRNQGSGTITSCPIEYNLNGAGYQSAGTYTGSISSGGTDTYTFTLDLSASGTYTLDARTQLAGDQNAANDAFTGYSVTNSTAHNFAASGDFTMGFEAGENTSGWGISDANSDGLTWVFFGYAESANRYKCCRL